MDALKVAIRFRTLLVVQDDESFIENTFFCGPAHEFSSGGDIFTHQAFFPLKVHHRRTLVWAVAERSQDDEWIPILFTNMHASDHVLRVGIDHFPPDDAIDDF